MTEITAQQFPANARAAVQDAALQKALERVPSGFVKKRSSARAALPEFDAIRDAVRDMKDHTLANLDLYLELFETQATAAGSQVHWARDAGEARQIILDICRKAGAKTVVKGKSMVSEEIHLNSALEEAGMTSTETDLGEYIIQLRGEGPSHIIAPALHVSRAEVEKDFRAAHRHLDPARSFPDARSLLIEARAELREKYFAAEVGITGANFLIAETGQCGLVTNEGNGDLVQNMSDTHIVLTGIEKVVPTCEDATALIRVLARSATGQEMSVYTTFSRGPRRPGDIDGPIASHIVLLDNGRSEMLASEFAEVLRCIRCGACLNHCPVYSAIGGHAYGIPYSGPIGAVVGPALFGLEATKHLPNASTFCGRCEEVCPVRIPLPKLMRAWRTREYESRLNPPVQRLGLRLWGWLARHPSSYRLAMRVAAGVLRGVAGRRGAMRRVPLAHRWTRSRDLPAPRRRHICCTDAVDAAGSQAVSGREEILGKLRAVRESGAKPHGTAVVEQRLAAAAPPGPVPAIAPTTAGRIERFTEKAMAVSADVRRVDGLAALPGAVAEELRARNLGTHIRIGSDPLLAGLNWGGLEPSVGAGRREEPVTLSRAAMGVAETGTLVFLSGCDNPVTLALLGEMHCAVLFVDDLLGNYEEAWARLRTAGGDPRTVNFITGPSRSGDIEQRIELGAHGPIAMTIFLVEGNAPE